VHEYVHTQQKTTDANSLLAQSVLEGVAEFVAVKTTGQPSPLAAMAYAKANDERIKQKFASQMFNPFNGFWLYSNAENEFGNRDLGYYVGYAICEKYHEKAADKKAAIKNMIELDYNNEAELSAFVNESGYFKKTTTVLKSLFEESRPGIVAIKPFKNNTTIADPAITQITVEFSTPMDKRYRNFDLGPIGEASLLRITRFVGFSDDGRSAMFEVKLKPAMHYQLLLGANFRNTDGISMKPYLLDFTTLTK
jgi:hypothetical protein